MYVQSPRFAFNDLTALDPRYATPSLPLLIQALQAPSGLFAPDDGFARVSGLVGAGADAAGADLDLWGNPWALPLLTQQVDDTRQTLHTREPTGQRLAGFDALPPWMEAELDDADAMQLMQLLIMLILFGGLRPPGGAGGAAPGSGGPTAGAGFNPNHLAPGRFVGVPDQGGRDLGSLSAPAAGPSGAANGITADQLRQIAPNLSAQRAAELTPHLNNAMAEAGITTRRQQAAFIGQLAQESGEFRYFEEIASGAAYEGRRDLGNTQPGDGRRFKGRGPIQLTGRANYRAAGRALGLDLENNPELVSRPDVGFRVAAWYWQSRGLNELAEAGDFREVTRRINGGYNGLAVRERYYQRALQVV